jgi:DNA-binding phage protein
MLRLAHPAPRGQGTDPPARRKWTRAPALSFTAEETRHIHAALRNAARAYGGMDVLATVLGMPVKSLYQAANPRRRPSGILAIRLAAAAGISVEAMLGGKLGEAGRCTTCGHRAAGGAA